VSQRFALHEVGPEFLDSAPLVLRESFEIQRPAAEVWEALTNDRPLEWCRLIDGTWTSPRPFGVGTTRTVKALGGALKLDEYFFRWEEGRRKSFIGVSASLPLFRSLAEDYLVEETGEASSRFTWTIGVAGRPPGPPSNAINRALLGTLFKDTRRHFSA